MSAVNDEAPEVTWRGRYQPALHETESKAGTAAFVTAAEIRGTVEQAVGRIEAVQGDARFSSSHKERASREAAVEAAWTVKQKAEAEFAEIAAELEEERAALRSKTVSRREASDVSGQIQDWEIRDVLRGMDPVKRSRYLMTSAGTDELEATLRAPALLTGIDPEIHESLTERAVKARYGGEFADLERAEQNLRAVQRVVENAYHILGDAVGSGAPIRPQEPSAKNEE